MFAMGTQQTFPDFVHNVCFALVSGLFRRLRMTAFFVCFWPEADLHPIFPYAINYWLTFD